MRRPGLVLLSLLFALALAAPATARAQDEETPDGDDANPFALSADELEVTKKFNELETHAIRSLQEKDFEGAERRYTKLIAKLDQDTVMNEPGRRKMQSYAHYNLACTYSLNKETEKALEEFEKSLELGFWGWKHIKKDTDLDNVRDEDAFVKSVRKWKKREAQSYVDAEEALIAQVTSSLAAKPVVKRYDFTITTSAGDELDRSELRGKVIVMHVFTPYDPEGASPEIAALVKLHADYKKKGVVVIGLTPMAANAQVGQWFDKFSEENDVKFPLAGVRPADPVFQPYNESFGQARLWFVDKRGKVRGTTERLKDHETLEKVVQMLLDAPVPEKK